MMPMKLFVLLILGLTVSDVDSAMEARPRMSELKTLFGTKKVHSDLNDEARTRIKTAIEANDGKIKATFKVTIGGFHTKMRIDMAGEADRGSAHGGARVPHAQIGPFMRMRVVKGEERMVPFTPAFDAIELTSEMVMNTISEDGAQAQIVADSALYLEIESTIKRVANGRGWETTLFPHPDMRPVIEFLGFASGMQ